MPLCTVSLLSKNTAPRTRGVKIETTPHSFRTLNAVVKTQQVGGLNHLISSYRGRRSRRAERGEQGGDGDKATLQTDRKK